MVYQIPGQIREMAQALTATMRRASGAPPGQRVLVANLVETSFMELPETVEVSIGEDPEGSVIWLHGLGADGHDFEPIVAELGLADQRSLRFVFPHAPMRPVTINGGVTMRAWYDVLTLDRGGPQDEAGIRESGRTLEMLIEREHERGIPYDKIVLAGFSQGGAIAQHTALRYPHTIAGLMVLSTWLPLGDFFDEEVVQNEAAQTRELPIFMAHGTFDPMLPLALGQHSRAALEQAGYKVEWYEYPMAHAVCAEEIADISNWLLSVFAQRPS